MERIKNFLHKIFSNLPLLIGIGLLFMDFLAFLAPILAHFGYTGIAHIIYIVFGYLCHQLPWRSLHLFDYQVAWCTRDTFIYFSMGLAGLFVHFFKIRGIKWYVAFLSIIPFGLDGTIQLIAQLVGIFHDQKEFFYASTNLQRALTGSLFGAAAGLWLMSTLAESIEEEAILEKVKVVTKKSVSSIKNFIYFFIIWGSSILLYIVLVHFWNITSPTHKPYGLFDHIRYFPGVNYEEVDRRGHAV
jgi:uncharacterized membrane protein